VKFQTLVGVDGAEPGWNMDIHGGFEADKGIGEVDGQSVEFEARVITMRRRTVLQATPGAYVSKKPS
jgi:hypothetical protein